MGDVKDTEHYQLSDKPEDSYPKLFVRASSDIEDAQDSSRIHKDEQNNFFSPEKTNGLVQAPDEEAVVTDFLLSISTSFKKEKTNGESSLAPEKEDLDEMAGVHRVLIDTAAPFESVKAAVSKFGGIVDWKAHRDQTVERRKFIEQELEQSQKDIPIYKSNYEEAEASIVRLLKELDSTKRLVEELKLNLEKAQTEDQQAKQDAELAKLRVEELEQGIEDEASISTKAQLEVARSRHIAAETELKTVENELEQLRNDYELLVLERERAVKKAEDSVLASKEAEKLVEEMTIELIDKKESLRFAHGSHLEAEEDKIGADADKEGERLNCEKEIKEAEETRERLEMNILVKRDKKKKLDAKINLLAEVKSKLAAYVESKSQVDAEKEALQKELEEVKKDIEKAFIDVNNLKMEEALLRLDIERERTEIYAVKQKEEKVKAIVSSLRAELSENQAKISSLQMKERETRERMTELPMQLQKAGQESNDAKMLANLAREEWEKQKSDTIRAKAEAKDIENKLVASKKEIEAAKKSEKLALEAINFVKENENDSKPQEGIITLSVEEYYKLNKRAQEAQEQADATVASVESQIVIAKQNESESLKKLEKVGLEMEDHKEALAVAINKAENAKEQKLNAEQELRVMRAERKNYVEASKNPRLSYENSESSISNNFISMPHTILPQKANVHDNDTENDASAEVKGPKKKKRYFPRFLMFFARRKVNANKSK